MRRSLRPNFHDAVVAIVGFVFGVSSLLSVSVALSAETVAEQRLQELLEEAWEFSLQEDPIFATDAGDNRYNDRLADDSPAGFARRHAAQKGFLARAEKVDAATLSENGRINLAIFKRTMRESMREYEFSMHLIPITNRWGFHVWFPQLPDKLKFATVKDYQDYIARLNALERYTDEQIALMRRGLKEQRTLPAIVLDGVDDVIKPHAQATPETSLLYKPFVEFPADIAAAEQVKLRAAAKEAIAERVIPSFGKFLKFMQQEYVPGARTSVGISGVKDGRAYYRHCVQKFTTLDDMSPEQVHEVGLREVARIRKEMEAIIKEVKFDGDFADFLKFLRTEERFYAKTPEELKKEVSYILKKMDGELPTLFKTLPRTPYGLKEVPLFVAPRTTTAYYQPPAGDGTRAGFYFLNTYNLKSRPLYELEALSLHEAVPGHHLQLALQQELTDVPPFRRFASFTAYIEGWALYSERLGLEVGFYQDPYSDFGRLTYEMWRACRLVVDSGIHYLGWTRQQAIAFMAKNTALSIHNIEAEVDRYISWPGQALGYKIGELKIRELRARAEKELGKAFDLREFHDVVLGSGAVPLNVLEDRVRGYIRHNRQ